MALIAGEMNLGVYQDSDDRYRWRLWSGLRLVAISGESFDDRLDAELAALCFKVDAYHAEFDVFAFGGADAVPDFDRAGIGPTFSTNDD